MNRRFIARGTTLLILVLTTDFLFAQEDSLYRAVKKDRWAVYCSSGPAFNMGKSGINADAGITYQKKWMNFVAGVEYAGTNQVRLVEVNFSGYLENVVSFKTGFGAHYQYKRWEVSDLLLAGWGSARVKYTRRNEHERFVRQSTFTLGNNLFINYFLSTHFKIGPSFSYIFVKARPEYSFERHDVNYFNIRMSAFYLFK